MLGLSALTWFVIIVAGYALLLLILPREYMWIPFVAVVVAMTVLAYHIVPDETDDFMALISPAAEKFLEPMARLSKKYTEERFNL